MRSLSENEFRVCKVTRFVVAHFTNDGKGNGSCHIVGEFPNIGQADEVGRALAVSMPDAIFTTVADRRTNCRVTCLYTRSG